MQYILNPSLQHMCLTKIATQLWTEDDQLTASVTSRLMPDRCSYDLNLFAKMREKVEHLPLPNSVKFQLLTFIEPIAFKIYDWYKYLYKNYALKNINLQDVRWTSSGTIDQVKSVEQLLKRDQSLELKQRYDLACTFCLVEQVQELLREMPEKEKLPPQAYSRLVRDNEQDLVVYFTQNVRHQLYDFDTVPEPDSTNSPYHEACHVAIASHNPTAAKFFFQKLNSAEKSLIFSMLRADFNNFGCFVYNRMEPHDFFAELVTFLLSRMNETERVQVLTIGTARVFKSLLTWPYYEFILLDTSHQLWAFLGESDFERLIYQFYLLCKMDRFKLAKYRGVYFELWRVCPVEFRRCVVDRLDVYYLYILYEAGEVELGRLILSAADTARKDGMMSSHAWSGLMTIFVSSGSWNFLKFFVEECGTTRETIVRFKEEFTNYYRDRNLDLDNNYQAAQFIQFLDDFYPESEIQPAK